MLIRDTIGVGKIIEMMTEIFWRNEIDVSDLVQEAYLATTHKRLSTRRPHHTLSNNLNQSCCSTAAGCADYVSK